MIVYHGSSEIVLNPDISHSYRPLDFGKGFYVTTNYDQAERWAKRKADLFKADVAYINSYELNEDFTDFNVKTFSEDLEEWIDFVCKCRDGESEYLQYDIIKGKVANDKVFRVVDLYHAGIWDKERALREIKVYPNYDQIAFISQSAIDKLLVYKSTDEV
ncbi:MAG: DUF3990 domain-containing protein [Lachnospiraceae bacterium]|nr:DUF3990 domain-containing protein [Lachnospiraceae bacterium]